MKVGGEVGGGWGGEVCWLCNTNIVHVIHKRIE